MLYSAIVTRQCRSLVGERKIGKSSLLTYIGHPQVMRRYGLDPDRQIILYLDLEGMASATPSDFWCEVLDALAQRLPEDLAAAAERLAAGEIRFMQVRRFLRRARDMGYELALCLDEFEGLARAPHFEADFYGELRSLAGELGVVYLTASKRSLYELTFEHGDTLSSPFFNIFTELPLSMLSEAEACELLSGLSASLGGPGFCPEDIQFAIKLSGTHPFFLQLAGFHLYEAPGCGGVRPADVQKQVRRRFLAEAEDHYRYLWSQLTLTQQMALVNLEQAAEPEIRILRMKNLVLEKGNRPAPFSETFDEFLRRQHTEQATVTGPSPAASLSGNTDLTGKTLGGYRVVSPIGRGGMAEVYKGYQPLLDRYVALKILAPHLADDPSFQERFQREATTVARLRHPNIVQVYDFGIAGELTYMVMEYIPGPSLKERLRDLAAEHCLAPLDETLQTASCVAAALDYAHAYGLVHRDVKPANILLRGPSLKQVCNAPEMFAVLTDFGVAKILEGLQLTAVGTTLGTPDYMSPEQARGGEITQGSDVYSLAVVVFEMLVGKLPFTAETPVATLLKHINEKPPRLLDFKPDLPPGLDQVMERALDKSPARRYRTAGEFVAALEAVL